MFAAEYFPNNTKHDDWDEQAAGQKGEGKQWRHRHFEVGCEFFKSLQILALESLLGKTSPAEWAADTEEQILMSTVKNLDSTNPS